MNMKEATEYDEDAWLEEEIQRELSGLDPSRLDQDQDDDCDNNNSEEYMSEEVTNPTDDLIPSMAEYVSWLGSQTKILEDELEECDQLLEHADIVSSRKPPDETDHYLLDIAKEEGVDVQALKLKILQEINQQDEADEKYLLTVDVTDSELLNGDLQSHENNDKNHADVITDNAGVKTDDCNSLASEIVQNHDNKDISIKKSGVVAEITEADIAEKQFWKQLKSLEDKRKEKENARNSEWLSWKAEQDKMTTELEQQRTQKQESLLQEKSKLERLQQELALRDQDAAEELQKQIEESLAVYERELAELTEQVHKDKNDLEEVRSQQKQKQQQQQQESAVKIQAFYRGYRTREEHGKEVREAIQYMKSWKEEERIEQIEKERRKEQERNTEKEIDQKKKLEDAKKDEERKLEEERNKQEEERKKQEEERKKQEEEKRKQVEKQKEEARKKEEERKREEEKREQEKQKELMTKLEEQKKQEEIKKEEQVKAEQLRKEQEAIKEQQRKKEEEKKKEEVKKKKEEERKRLEEKKKQEQKAEEEMLKRETEQRKEDTAKICVTENNLKQNNTATSPVNQNKTNVETESASENTVVNNGQSSDKLKLTSAVEVEQIPDSLIKPKVTPTTSSKLSAPSTTKEPFIPKPPSKSKVSHGVSPRPNSGGKSKPAVNVNRKSRVFLTGLKPPDNWGLSLPDNLEAKRLGWIEKCVAWSKVLGELRTRRPAASKKPPRRPISAKKLLLLEQTLILRSSGQSDLLQVTSLELCDIPACNISTLAQCTQLRTLRMNNCNLVTTDGIERCQFLQYIDFTNNKIEVISCMGLSQLIYLNLSHNALSSVHGLDRCSKLKHLNLSYNKITRIAGLDHLQSLHTLDFSHNQLITSRGVSVASTIQVLNLSHNHLPNLDDIDQLGLLQSLDITGNSVLQLPKLLNHVLLHNLVLDNNNFSSLGSLDQAWLPMLHSLSIGTSGLLSFPDLPQLFWLENLDISNNQILDVSSVLPGLVSLRGLLSLQAQGNPASEESDWKSLLVEYLPQLTSINRRSITGKKPAPLQRTSYESMCSAQLKQHLLLLDGYVKALNSAKSLEDKLTIHNKYFTQSYNLATEHRYMHEYGEITNKVNTTIDTNFLAPVESPKESKPKSELADMRSKFEAALKSSNSTAPTPKIPEQIQKPEVVNDQPDLKSSFGLFSSSSNFGKSISDESKASPNHVDDVNKQSKAEATDMKAKFDAMLKAKNPPANNTSNSLAARTVGKVLQQEGILPTNRHVQAKAATKIQALWRGYILRKCLQIALSFARQQISMDDDDDLAEFGEVDLNTFNFNEDDLDKDWLPPEAPQLPRSHAVLKPPSGPVDMVARQQNHTETASRQPNPPNHPRHAWKQAETFSSDKPPLPPLSRLSNHTTSTYTENAHTTRSKQSKKEEKITEEWGFKDTRTAELMLQRAKKLKYNADKKKKLGQLDPKQRLALYRKLEEASKTKPQFNMPPRRGSQRKDYFMAREEEQQHEHQLKTLDNQQDNQARTFEWLHTQVGEYEVTSSRIQNRDPASGNRNKKAASYHSEGNLPRIDPTVLAGGRATLTASPSTVDLQSIESASMMGDVPQPRRLSMTETVSSDRLPPIKTNSAPSVAPERMSWRNKRTDVDIGWGGGKKRGKVP